MTTPIDRAAIKAMIARLRGPFVVWIKPALSEAADLLEAQQATIAARDAEIVRLTKERDVADDAVKFIQQQRDEARAALVARDRLLDWCKMRLREPYRNLFDKYRVNPPPHDPDAPPLVLSEADANAERGEARAALAKAVSDEREACANIAATMAERPYDNEPEFSAVLAVEAAIRARSATS